MLFCIHIDCFNPLLLQFYNITVCLSPFFVLMGEMKLTRRRLQQQQQQILILTSYSTKDNNTMKK
eukprot:m.40042 g.40042  ORF g.40042 m.40042 type:complete len:65 (+) comp10313_c0_seq2:287-481(+)